MSDQETILTVENGYAVFTMNRPAAMNALTLEMMQEQFPAMVERVKGDPDIRALVLTGAGGAFCTGADVKKVMNRGPAPAEQRSNELRRTLGWLYELVNLPIPVISAVDGPAYGAGMSLAIAADFVLASTRAKFCQVFGRIGLIPDMGSGYLLPRAVGIQRAKELVFTGRSVGAAEAVELGIALSIHEPEELMPAARALAGRLAKASPTAIAEAKGLLGRSLGSTQAEMVEAELAAQQACRTSAFHAEAVRRFAAKEPQLYNWDQMDKAGA